MKYLCILMVAFICCGFGSKDRISSTGDGETRILIFPDSNDHSVFIRSYVGGKKAMVMEEVHLGGEQSSTTYIMKEGDTYFIDEMIHPIEHQSEVRRYQVPCFSLEREITINDSVSIKLEYRKNGQVKSYQIELGLHQLSSSPRYRVEWDSTYKCKWAGYLQPGYHKDNAVRRKGMWRAYTRVGEITDSTYYK